MLKIYLKQAIGQLKEHPLFSLISILGTALSITMIMVIISVYQITNGDYKPEVNKSRTLYVKSLLLKNDAGYSDAGYWGLRIAKECFSSLEAPEEVSFVSIVTKTLLETTDHALKEKGDCIYTDDTFWRIFKFRFLAGKSFGRDDVDADSKRVVIAESTAKRLFQSAEAAIGQSVLIGRKIHTVCGVVADVSPLAVSSYAQVWIPYAGAALTGVLNEETGEGTRGPYTIVLLARSPKDFPAIQKEIEQRVDQVNKGLSEWQIDLVGQPDTFFTSQLRVWMNRTPETTKAVQNYIVMILIVLLVPAMNLSGLSATSIQNRLSELGVRKAFGATTGKLYTQILTENLIVTLLGGLIGLVCSYTVIALIKEKLFGSFRLTTISSELTLNMDMLFQPAIFIYALLFCLCLNLLSTGIPAWNATRKPIIYALKQELI